MIFPQKLIEGDKVMIVTPATEVRADYIDGAKEWLERQGLRVVIGDYAKGPADGSFAATCEQRLVDFRRAFRDPEVKAILCARGGYGCVHLLEALQEEVTPKWVIGFSDVTALHGLMNSHGIASLHSPMAKHLTILPDSGDVKQAWRASLMSDEPLRLQWESREYKEYNVPGVAAGRLVGGNMALLHGLADTPFFLPDMARKEDCILFIEDVSEAIYAVERMLYRMKLSGILDHIKGLVVGRFTNYKPDKNFATMEEMIDAFMRRNNLASMPIAYNAPIGHVDCNMPVIEGAMAELNVSKTGATLTMYKQ